MLTVTRGGSPGNYRIHGPSGILYTVVQLVCSGWQVWVEEADGGELHMTCIEATARTLGDVKRELVAHETRIAAAAA